MGRVLEELDERCIAFMRAQHVFFVASAPRDAAGLVNLSPKGILGLEVIDPRTVAYLDFVGSGIETVAHLRENGRIVFMFCAFEGPPLILRLHGRGDVIEPGDAEWDALAARFPEHGNARAIIRARIERISESCGYGVPLLRYEGERSQLFEWAERKGAEGIERYKAEKNRKSLDGLPGLRKV
jgi:hypothetical protein